MGYWPFENDISNLGSNGVAVAARGTASSSFVPGVIGRAMKVEIGPWESLPTPLFWAGRGPKAFSLWATPATSSGTVVGCGVATAPGGTFRVAIQPTALLFSGFESDLEVPLPDAGASPWRHVAVVYEVDSGDGGGWLSVYGDGFLLTRSQLPVPLDTVSPSSFFLTNADFAGTIDDYRVYTRSLNACEVLELALVTDPVRIAACNATTSTPTGTASPTPTISPAAASFTGTPTTLPSASSTPSPSLSPRPIDVGLSVYLPFDGDLTDRGASQLNLTAYPGMTWRFIPGMVGQAVGLNPAGAGWETRDFVTTLPSGEGQRTVAFWLGGGSVGGLLSWGGTTHIGGLFRLDTMQPSGKLNFYAATGGAQMSIGSTTAAWRHICLTYWGGPFLNLYVDGVLKQAVGPQMVTLDTVSPSAFELANGLLGQLDELRIYTRVLSECEILTLALVTDPGRLANCSSGVVTWSATPSPSAGGLPPSDSPSASISTGASASPSPSATGSAPDPLQQGLLVHYPLNGTFDNVGSHRERLVPGPDADASFIPAVIGQGVNVSSGWWNNAGGSTSAFPSGDAPWAVSFWAQAGATGTVMGWGWMFDRGDSRTTTTTTTTTSSGGGFSVQPPVFSSYSAEEGTGVTRVDVSSRYVEVWYHVTTENKVAFDLPDPEGSEGWRHIAVTYSGPSSNSSSSGGGNHTLTLYLNGAPLGQAQVAQGFSTAARGMFYMAGGPDLVAKPFTGGLDDLRVYTRELPQCQVQALAAMPGPPPSCGPPSNGPAGANAGGGGDALALTGAIAGSIVAIAALAAAATGVYLRGGGRLTNNRRSRVVKMMAPGFNPQSGYAAGGSMGPERTQERLAQLSAAVPEASSAQQATKGGGGEVSVNVLNRALMAAAGVAPVKAKQQLPTTSSSTPQTGRAGSPVSHSTGYSTSSGGSSTSASGSSSESAINCSSTSASVPSDSTSVSGGLTREGSFSGTTEVVAVGSHIGGIDLAAARAAAAAARGVASSSRTAFAPQQVLGASSQPPAIIKSLSGDATESPGATGHLTAAVVDSSRRDRAAAAAAAPAESSALIERLKMNPFVGAISKRESSEVLSNGGGVMMPQNITTAVGITGDGIAIPTAAASAAAINETRYFFSSANDTDANERLAHAVETSIAGDSGISSSSRAGETEEATESSSPLAPAPARRPPPASSSAAARAEKASAIADAIAERVRAAQAAAAAAPTRINYVPSVQLLGGRNVPCPVDYDEAIKAGFTPELWWKATHDEATGKRRFWHKTAKDGTAALVCTCFKCRAPDAGSSVAT